MLPSFPPVLATGYPNDFALFSYGLPLLFHIKCTANFGIETPEVEMCLTLVETPCKNNFAFMQFLSTLAY